MRNGLMQNVSFPIPTWTSLKKKKEKKKKKKRASRVNKDLFPHLKAFKEMLAFYWFLIFVSVTSWDPHWRVSNSKGYFPLARRNRGYMRKRPKPIWDSEYSRIDLRNLAFFSDAIKYSTSIKF